mgnify:FL=1
MQLDMKEADLSKEMALVETVLFLESEPKDSASLARIAKLSKETVDDVIELLKQKYRADNCGIQIEQIAGGWMLSPKKETWENI